MEDIFGEKGLIEQILLLEMEKDYLSGSPSFWKETSPKASAFFLGGEYAGAVCLTNGQWRAYTYIPAFLLIGKGSTERSQHLISSRKKVEAKKAVVDFYKKVLRDERYI